MSYPNGRFPDSALIVITGSRLAVEPGLSWIVPGGPQDNGLRPSGYENGYRDYATQLYYWNLYTSGRGNLAAYPGESVHGVGRAIDVAYPWMREWLDEHGMRFGWKKTEAFSEWWHMNYVWTDHRWPKPFVPLALHSRGPRVVKLTRRLHYIVRPNTHHRYLDRKYTMYRWEVVRAIRQFQKDHHLVVDGICGEKTMHMITAVFHRQWENKHDGHTKHHGELFNVTLLEDRVRHHPTRGEFARDLLRRINAPVTTHNMVAMMAWMQAEGDAGRFNPLNTTERMPWSTSFNSAGVQNYVDYSDGVTATARTLIYGTRHDRYGYGAIVHDLRKNRPAVNTLAAVERSAWGTGGGAQHVREVDGWKRLIGPEYLHHRVVQ